MILVAFAFGGVESVGVTAGEAGDVKKTIPKAINGVFWRILIFYIGAILVMVSLYNWKDIGAQGSPFVFIFSRMGIPAAAYIINLFVITAGVSSMNMAIYASTRLMYNLALQGQAPAFLTKGNKSKVPFAALILTVGTQIVGIIANYLMPTSAFAVFSSIVVIGLIANWIAILFSQLKFVQKNQNGKR